MTEEQEQGKKSIPPMVPNNFKIKHLSSGDFQDMEMNPSQNVSTPVYSDPEHGDRTPIFQTPWMDHNVHGIPLIHPEYYPNDEKRDFIKIPLDVKRVPKMKPFRDMLVKIDGVFGSDEFKAEKFGQDSVADHIYTAIVRLPQPPPKPKKGAKPYVPPPPKKDKNGKEYERIDKMKVEFFKCKFDFEYPKKTGEKEKDKEANKSSKKKKKKPKTSDDEEEQDEKSPENNDYKKTRIIRTKVMHYINKKNIPIPVKTASDVVKAMPWGSKVRYVVSMPKIGEMKAQDRYGNYIYNVGFKILLIQVKPKESAGSSSQNINEDQLVSDSEDDLELEGEDDSDAKSKKKNKNKKAASDSDEDEKPATKGKSKKPPSDSDEDEKPAAKNKGKVKKPPSDSDEDEKPVAKGKSKKPDAKGKSKKPPSDSDEDEKPAPKSKGKTKKPPSDSDEDKKPPAKAKKSPIDADTTDEKPAKKGKAKKPASDSDEDKPADDSE
jgi:hypothetical protein